MTAPWKGENECFSTDTSAEDDGTSVSFSVYLHGLWVSENDIYFYFMPARFKRPFQIFMFISFFLFILYWYVLCDEKNVRISGVLFLSFSLAWGEKYIENLLFKLFNNIFVRVQVQFQMNLFRVGLVILLYCPPPCFCCHVITSL